MNNKWWDNYSGEKVVIIEDVGKTHEWMGDYLKIWADRYPFRAEVKQASLMIRPEVIIVTSNYHPKDLWGDESVLGPLLRRFEIVQFHGELGSNQRKRPRLERQNAMCDMCHLAPCQCKEAKDDDSVEEVVCTACRLVPCKCQLTL